MAIQGARADMLSEQFKAISGLLRDTIISVPDEKWQAPTSGDGLSEKQLALECEFISPSTRRFRAC